MFLFSARPADHVQGAEQSGDGDRGPGDHGVVRGHGGGEEDVPAGAAVHEEAALGQADHARGVARARLPGWPRGGAPRDDEASAAATDAAAAGAAAGLAGAQLRRCARRRVAERVGWPALPPVRRGDFPEQRVNTRSGFSLCMINIIRPPPSGLSTCAFWKVLLCLAVAY